MINPTVPCWNNRYRIITLTQSVLLYYNTTGVDTTAKRKQAVGLVNNQVKYKNRINIKPSQLADVHSCLSNNYRVLRLG